METCLLLDRCFCVAFALLHILPANVTAVADQYAAIYLQLASIYLQLNLTDLRSL
jgi:hypothetical protein